MAGETERGREGPDGARNGTEHWLIAAWPGMANVAILAAGFLIQKLGLRLAGQIPPRGHFDIQSIEVRAGVVATPRLPRSLLYSGIAPSPGADGRRARITVFLGEAQPASGAYAYALGLLDKAHELGVTRVITFASMASQLHPTESPRVFGAGTRAPLIEQMRSSDVQPLEEGQISGLNGVLLGAAAERELPGVCLLGEIPFFAPQIPSPKAARAVLDAFSAISGIDLDTSELSEHAEKIDRVLLEMLERVQGQQEEGEGAEFADPEEPDSKEMAGERAAGRAKELPAKSTDTPIDLRTRERIEGLFETARKDRSQAMSLKRELDRLGVFAKYEDRFLDLFRRGE